jgi:hypothetical protein
MAALSLLPEKPILILWRRCYVGRWGDGMPHRHLTRNQAHPTQVLTERLYVGVQLRGVGTGHTITPYEAMVVAALSTPSRGCASPARAVVPAHSFPRLGELVVVVSWVPRREEDHVVAIAVAKGHEL